MIFDALDEAVDPRAIAEALCWLMRFEHLWLVVGSQRSELGFVQEYSQRVTVIDLDSDDYSRDTDLASYVADLLSVDMSSII